MSGAVNAVLVAAALLATARMLRDFRGRSIAWLTVAVLLFGTSLWRAIAVGDTTRGMALLAGTPLLWAAWLRNPARRRSRASQPAVQQQLFVALAAAIVMVSLHSFMAPPATVHGLERLALLAPLFSPVDGLLQRAPLLWLVPIGVAVWGRRHPRWRIAVALLAAAVLAASRPVRGEDVRWEPLLPIASLPLALALSRLRALLRRRPQALLIAGGAALVVWNFAFMEQYRTLLPKDETVSFARVSGGNAALFAARFGSPLSWPANWLFAARHGVSPDLYDGLAGRTFLMDGRIELAVAESGHPALAGGWGDPLVCGTTRCREFNGRARLLLPGEGRALREILISGEGAVGVEVNGLRAGSVRLGPAAAALAVPPGAWKKDAFNEVGLVSAEAVRIERVVLVPAP